MSNNISAILKRRRKELGYTLLQIADAVGVSEATVQRWESGNIKTLRHENLVKLASILNISPAALMGWEDEAARFPANVEPLRWNEPVPLVGDIACGTPILAEQNITDYVDTPEHIHADFALRCRGESMVDAGVHDGDIVFIRQQPQVDNGQIAAVMIEGEESEATLKRVYMGDGVLTLQAANPAFAPRTFIGEAMARVSILGRAVGYLHVFSE